ncbi:MAG: penicillin-binding protein activator LpoB [Treponema sp.]|nr:penicillin-binding protein activator LpoB [Treponema sp.]
MKKFLSALAAVFLLVAVFTTCSSRPTVRRVDSDTTVDLSGRWNDTDARLVSNSLINDCINSPRVMQFIRDYIASNNGRLPASIVGSFRNESSEHIDTAIIARAMEAAILNSGRMDFVAGGDTREELRTERQDQQWNASEETRAALRNETGATFLLTGTISSIVDQAGRDTVRSYFVTAELTNIETNVRLWIGENSEIKKTIRQPLFRR